ncbi:DUF2796 domain-containing protein [Roseateles sp. SL47]|uniref:DUF2796 domain-containing protein n=1 Tax=Roseateles sp. SL47 TaxID=2995138 RepID=UPI00226DD3F9|nr:DUF2796 domain-containing protein [Roseateles sp. SL47]WAC71719.1 DUF2796 domain-containing protein [Roseateles sp. SL47]
MAALIAAIAAPAAEGHGGAHEHGVLHLDVAMDGTSLVIQMESPLDNVLGFEHPPRTAAQRQAVAQMLSTLRQGDRLFQPLVAAGCTFKDATLESALLDQPAAAASEEHMDMDASYTFTCTAPDRLTSITHTLFASFVRLQRVEVQTAVATGQGHQTLRRPDSVIRMSGR